MRQSKLLIPTIHESSADSGESEYLLLQRAGFVRKTGDGRIIYLPLAHRVLQKIKGIIQEELGKIDAVEMTLPIVYPVAQGVQEEVSEAFILDLIQQIVTTYDQLPINVYHMPRRIYSEANTTCEMLVSESFSFHVTPENQEEIFRQYEAAYHAILTRCELVFKSILGTNKWLSQNAKDFVALSPQGKESIAISTESDYAAASELATSLYTSKKSHATYLEKEKVATPVQRSIQDIAQYLDVTVQKMIQTIFCIVDEQPVLFVMRGDHRLNITKVQNFLQTTNIRQATEAEANEYFQTSLAEVSPVDTEITIYADAYVEDLVNIVTTANQAGFHYINVNPNRDFKPLAYFDFRQVDEGELSPDGSGSLILTKAVKIGEIVKVSAELLQQHTIGLCQAEHAELPVTMGYYQLNVSRLLVAIIEQHSDHERLVWPRAIAPFDVHILQLTMTDEYQTALVSEVYETLTEVGYEVLIDDRKEDADVKQTDAHLIGCPFCITVGAKAVDGVIEVKIQQSNAVIEVRKEELVSTLEILLHEE